MCNDGLILVSYKYIYRMSETGQIILYYVNGGDIPREVKEENKEGSEHENQKIFKCNFCTSTFDRELGLYGHLNSHKVINRSLTVNLC